MNITTPRLVIRHFSEADYEDYMSYQALPEVREFMDGEPQDEERAVQFLTQQAGMKGDERGKYHAYAVYHQADGKVIGDVGFFLEPGPVEKGDLGFQFHPDYHGKGYAREAAEALMRHGFLILNLHRITSGCDARNLSSFLLMERLGMRREAHCRQSQITNGVLHDTYQYALLRDEWLPRQTEGSGSIVQTS